MDFSIQWIDAICEPNNTFWNYEKSWNTTTPEFSRCFHRTGLIWIPSIFLWIVLPLDLLFVHQSKERTFQWNWQNISRQVISTICIIASAIDCLLCIIHPFDDFTPYPVDYYATFIRFICWLLIGILFHVHRIRGIYTSGLVWLYLFLSTILGALTFYSCIMTLLNYDEKVFQLYEVVLYMVQYVLTIALLVITSFADGPIVSGDEEGEKISTIGSAFEPKVNICPKSTSSFLSKILFWWFNALVIQGWRKSLTFADLWTLRHRDKCSTGFNRFLKYWVKEEEKIASKSKSKKVKSKKPGVAWIIVQMFWSPFIAGALLRFAANMLEFANPQILKLLIGFASSKEPLWHGLLYACVMALTTLVQTNLRNLSLYKLFLCGFRARATLISAIYQKSLKLSNAARRVTTIGEIVNLMAVDAGRFNNLLILSNNLWQSPVIITTALVFLWQELGVAVLGGVAIMILFIPANAYLTSISKRLQTQQMKLKDERVKAMNEMLNGVKVLKLYAWENAFTENILKIRTKELNQLRKIAYLGCILQVIWFCAPFFVSVTTFVIYILMDENNVLDAQKAFVSLSLFNMMRQPLNQLPNDITNLIMASVSIKRLNTYFNAPELSGYVARKEESDAISIESGNFNWGDESDESVNEFKKIKGVTGKNDRRNTVQNNGTVAKNGLVENNNPKHQNQVVVRDTLRNISIKVPTGSFVAIVGSVGSGKSSLLSAILGEMEWVSGRVNIKPNLQTAYVSQQAWIQNATLKNNILFGTRYDQVKYDKIISACALRPDLAILPGGDETEIGEKGINLSGGQKQRVSLARACYSDADLLLLDDPLSAVDAHVGSHIFHHVLHSKTGLLKNKTRVLVTNHLALLPDVDQIVVLKDGAISEMGTYDQLMMKKGDFAELVANYTSTASEESRERKDSTIEEEEIIAIQRKVSEAKTRSALQKTEGAVKSKLVKAEHAETGRVKRSVFKHYLSAITWKWCIMIAFGYISVQCMSASSNTWLSIWSNHDGPTVEETRFYLLIYSILGLSPAIFVVWGWYSLTSGTIRAAGVLHKNLLERIMHSPMVFFDTTPLGRILNRFSGDINSIDVTLQMVIKQWVTQFLQAITAIIMIALQTPIFLAVVVPLSVIYYMMQKVYIMCGRQLRRLGSVSSSPIYSHFGETLSGMNTIRAYSAHERFIVESSNRVDRHICVAFHTIASNRWLAIRLEILGICVIFFAALFAVLGRESGMDAGTVGLSVSYALQITNTLQMMVRNQSEVESEMVAVERVMEYSKVDNEAKWYIEETKPKSDWPDSGVVDFDNYSTRYREGLDLVLKGVDIHIAKGEKVGIVGRTGAGKSSLTLALFRLIEAADGKIVIDNLDVSKIGLHQLRSRLTIIPQDPILFSGTLRSNLDPFGVHTDEQIWRALEHSYLKEFAQSLDAGIEHKVAEGGENLSVGQRQLICLGRALLRNTPILILDEATAAVDLETDSLIQETIRKEFANCTILTIAHRINTIMNYDRVLVLNDGKVAEFDTPANLLSNENTIFYTLAKDAGII